MNTFDPSLSLNPCHLNPQLFASNDKLVESLPAIFSTSKEMNRVEQLSNLLVVKALKCNNPSLPPSETFKLLQELNLAVSQLNSKIHYMVINQLLLSKEVENLTNQNKLLENIMVTYQMREQAHKNIYSPLMDSALSTLLKKSPINITQSPSEVDETLVQKESLSGEELSGQTNSAETSSTAGDLPPTSSKLKSKKRKKKLDGESHSKKRGKKDPHLLKVLNLTSSSQENLVSHKG